MNEERLKFAERFGQLATLLGYHGHGKQTRLAAHYHKAQPSVKKWFDGDAQPDYEICVDICKRAKVHFEWLMTGRGPKSFEASREDESLQHQALSLVYLDTEELKIITAFRESTTEGKGLFLAAAETAPRAASLDLFIPRNKP